jgi:ribonuclease III
LSQREALERRLGHRFSSPALLEQALAHRSSGAQHNERLEFLGDGVLGCAIAEALYARFPALPEGKLTRLRAQLVRKETLSELGHALGLAEQVRTGAGAPLTPSIVADAVEAVFGAIFLDAGYEGARRAIERAFADLVGAIDPEAVGKDAKTQLQELMHARRKKLPEYRLTAEKRGATANVFEVACVLPDLGLTTSGTGASRQQAEQQAAHAMLQELGA